jgi:hypothetical protein
MAKMIQDWLHERTTLWMALLSLFVLLLLLYTDSSFPRPPLVRRSAMHTVHFRSSPHGVVKQCPQEQDPGGTPTGAGTGGAKNNVVLNTLLQVESVAGLDCDDSDPVRHDLYIPSTVDTACTMSTVGVSPSSSISGDSLMARRSTAILDRDLMGLQERDAEHGRHGAKKRQKSDPENIPGDM